MINDTDPIIFYFFFLFTYFCNITVKVLPFFTLLVINISPLLAAVIDVAADEHELNIYPNPAYNELTIAAAGIVTDVAIINSVGQVVRSYKYGSRKVTMNIADISVWREFGA